MWRVGTYYSRFDLLAVFLKVLAVMLSPWAFLAAAIVSCKRSLKLQTYCATGLFIWAVLLQMWIVIFALLSQPIYYRPFA